MGPEGFFGGIGMAVDKRRSDVNRSDLENTLHHLNYRCKVTALAQLNLG